VSAEAVDPVPHATRRYRALIEQLGDVEGRCHGWKRRVAERLAVHPSYVSRILSGSSANVGRLVIDRACDALGLDPHFFSEDLAHAPDHRDFLAHRDDRWLVERCNVIAGVVVNSGRRDGEPCLEGRNVTTRSVARFYEHVLPRVLEELGMEAGTHGAEAAAARTMAVTQVGRELGIPQWHEVETALAFEAGRRFAAAEQSEAEYVVRRIAAMTKQWGDE